ncbi:Arylsulfatase A [Nonlabens sp. Hel1_33_55]|uniref:sulfatase family protein n=1 Tax=Nonlabens sp. Hel1_33_55 TaxID=1336802 RepID=UPI000875B410|nr:sulfatase [Nonlabens sp. Hel1_33_55]SCX99820.1 Arylsulfatase A [Nonlabens sp. Hel1_33_55]
MKFLQLTTILLLIVSCKSKKEVATVPTVKPNILWIVCEDISPMLSFYGDSTAQTPVLDQLASESMVYDNAFAVVGVCGPSRSSIITGMYPTAIGTQHMRTGTDITSWGKRVYKKETGRYDLENQEIIQYSAVIPEYVKAFPEYMRKAGYYTTNNDKTDYQFAAPVTVWDQNDKNAHWRNRPDGEPFFSVFNFNVTHESMIWKNAEKPQTVDPATVPLPAYFQDTPSSRNDVARVYSNIELLDQQVGELLQQLKDDGLYDDTIIFFYSDHGGPLPRQKREIYDSGLKVPFMVKDLRGTSGRSDQVVSFVDLAPTVLNIASVTIPEHIQGRTFLGPQMEPERTVAFATSDRFDGVTDRSRAARNERFLYIEHDFPEKMWYKDIDYRKQVPMMEEMLRFRESGKLNSIQQQWFTDKQKTELYDCIADPENLVNLAGDPNYAKEQMELMLELQYFRRLHKDRGLEPEASMIASMWPGFEQPVTMPVQVKVQNGKAILSSPTTSASIGYVLSNEPLKNLDLNSGWNVYHKPLTVEKGQYLYTMAQRIGLAESEVGTNIIP